jgi:glycosyltransferase involved in cell wall biosynthesis
MPPYRNRLLQRESLDGIDVVRVWTYLAPNTAIARRSLDFASFGISSFLAGLFQRTDVIVATSPQLLAGLSGRLLALMKRRPWLLEVRDLWPDSIVALDMMRERHPAIRLLRAVEHNLYRSAARIVTTNDGLRVRLIQSGVPAEKIGVVPNSVDPLQFSPRPRPPELAEKYSLNGHFVVGYIGTQGIAHDFDSMLEAAAALRDKEITFLLVGEGAQHLTLTRRARALKLENVRFVRPVPHSEVPDHIACCDVLLVPMKRSTLLNDTMPSKIFEIAAMERPILIAAEGIAVDLITSHNAGLAIEPEDPASLIAAIERLRNDPALALAMKAGCRRLADDFNRDTFAARMLDEIRRAAAAR